MTKTKLRACDIEAYAWATLAASRKRGNRTDPVDTNGTRQLAIIEAGAILGFAAVVAFLGLSAASTHPHASAHSHERTRLSAGSNP